MKLQYIKEIVELPALYPVEAMKAAFTFLCTIAACLLTERMKLRLSRQLVRCPVAE